MASAAFWSEVHSGVTNVGIRLLSPFSQEAMQETRVLFQMSPTPQRGVWILLTGRASYWVYRYDICILHTHTH